MKIEEILQKLDYIEYMSGLFNTWLIDNSWCNFIGIDNFVYYLNLDMHEVKTHHELFNYFFQITKL